MIRTASQAPSQEESRPQPPKHDFGGENPYVQRVTNESLSRLGQQWDGTMIAAAHDGHIALYPLDGGEPRDLEEVPASASVIRFTPDGRFLFFAEDGERSINIYRVELTTGHRELWKTLEADPVGFDDVYAIQVADDGESYYYTFQRRLSDLFLVQGLH